MKKKLNKIIVCFVSCLKWKITTKRESSSEARGLLPARGCSSVSGPRSPLFSGANKQEITREMRGNKENKEQIIIIRKLGKFSCFVCLFLFVCLFVFVFNRFCLFVFNCFCLFVCFWLFVFVCLLVCFCLFVCLLVFIMFIWFCLLFFVVFGFICSSLALFGFVCFSFVLFVFICFPFAFVVCFPSAVLRLF